MKNRVDTGAHLASLKQLSAELDPKKAQGGNVLCMMFDVYGTLFIGNSETADDTLTVVESLERLTRTYNIKQDPEDLAQQLYAAIEESHEDQKKEGIEYPEVQIDRIWSKVLGRSDMSFIREFAVAFEMIANPVCPTPHLEELLQCCKRKRVVLGIISNAQFYTPLLFERFLGADLGDLGFCSGLTLFSYRQGMAKPCPTLFEAARQQLGTMGIPAGNTLFLGNDMLNDILPARTVGFQTALFTGDPQSLNLRETHPDCDGLLPDAIITGLDQLIDYLG